MEQWRLFRKKISRKSISNNNKIKKSLPLAETSIIIRTKNEEKWIGENLKRLAEQTYKNF